MRRSESRGCGPWRRGDTRQRLGAGRPVTREARRPWLPGGTEQVVDEADQVGIRVVAKVEGDHRTALAVLGGDGDRRRPVHGALVTEEDAAAETVAADPQSVT